MKSSLGLPGSFCRLGKTTSRMRQRRSSSLRYKILKGFYIAAYRDPCYLYAFAVIILQKSRSPGGVSRYLPINHPGRELMAPNERVINSSPDDGRVMIIPNRSLFWDNHVSRPYIRWRLARLSGYFSNNTTWDCTPYGSN